MITGSMYVHIIPNIYIIYGFSMIAYSIYVHTLRWVRYILYHIHMWEIKLLGYVGTVRNASAVYYIMCQLIYRLIS